MEETQSGARFAKGNGVRRRGPGRPGRTRTPPPPSAHGKALTALLNELLRGTMDLHNVIADVFLNHQAQLSTPPQPFLRGFPHGV